MRHVIVDGNNYCNIALYRNLSSHLGAAESVILSATKKLFLQMCKKLQREFNETSQYYMVWDHPNGSAWRKKLMESYKSTRNHSEHLKKAIAIGKLIAEECMMLNMEILDAEADDAIYALCETLEGEKIIISRDHDMLQIVQAGFAEKVWDPVTKHAIEVPAYDIVLFKCLTGDSSDNIPGIPGIGPKRAEAMLAKGIPDELMAQVAKNRHIIRMASHPDHDRHLVEVKAAIEGATYAEIR